MGTRAMRRGAAALTVAGLAAVVAGCEPVDSEFGWWEPILGDLNGDGRIDRVTLVQGAQPCAADVEYGRAGGGYDPAVHVEYEAPPDEADWHCPDMGVVVDIGGDGTPNLVFAWFDGASSAPYDLSVYTNDFTFVEGVDTEVDQPSVIGHADFDGDGLEDVYEVTDQGDGFQTYLNTPAGDLVPGPIGQQTVSFPEYRLADFDEDGAIDLAISYVSSFGTPEQEVVVILDDGTRVSLLLEQARAVEVGDYDGDGHKDVRATVYETGEVLTWLGNGDGTFTPA